VTLRFFLKIIFFLKSKKTRQVYALLGRNTVVLTQVIVVLIITQ